MGIFFLLYALWIGYRMRYQIKSWMKSNWLPFVVFSLAGMFFIGFTYFLAGFCGYVCTISLRRWQLSKSVRFEVQPALIGAGIYALFTLLIYGFNVQIFTVPAILIQIAAVGALIGLWWGNGDPGIKHAIRQARSNRR